LVGNLPLPRTAWQTGPAAPPIETAFDALLMEATLAYIDEADDDAPS
jgi:hypothetical protein